jgi:hypothetical protein
MDELTVSFLDARFEFPEGLPGGTFWVVTACNPDGQVVSADANHRADVALAAELDRCGLTRRRANGGSPDWSHVEPGWAVLCGEEEALRLGRQFRQLAVFALAGGAIDLVDCQTARRTRLAMVLGRVRSSAGGRPGTS